MHKTCLMVMALLQDKKFGHRILLIKKNKPDWQLNKLNLVGGHVEEGESLKAAIVREVFEETGLTVDSKSRFEHRVTLICQFGNVYLYHALADIQKASQKTKEKLEYVNLGYLHERNIMDNLKWIIPLMLDGKLRYPITIEYDFTLEHPHSS